MMATPDRYLAFARFEATGSSPVYERLARTVAETPRIVELLDRLPGPKRQPNLLFAAARLAEAPIGDPARFIEHVTHNWDEISSTIRGRATQTNEAARTGTILPMLARISGPIALIEVGCSAGLCLFPDRYSISYDHRPPTVNGSPVRIDVATSGPVPIPRQPPEIVARIGIDLDPIDLDDADSRRWLEMLVWPEHNTRVERLRAAISVVRAEPPTMLRGDLNETIDDAIGLVPSGAVPVVFHSAVLNYLLPQARVDFATRLRQHRDVVWISNEGPGVVEGLTTELRPPATADSAGFFITALDGSVVGISDPHGSWISWQ